MKKFELTALSSDRARLLAAPQKTQLVEPVFPEEEADGAAGTERGEREAMEARVKRGITFLTSLADGVREKDGALRAALSDTIVITYEQFLASAAREEEFSAALARLESCAAAISERRAERGKLSARMAQLAPYLGVKEPLSVFCDTRSTKCFFGLVEERMLPALTSYAESEPLAALTIYEGAKQRPVALVCHREIAELAAAVLAECAFARCELNLAHPAAEESALLARAAETLAAEEAALAEEGRKEIALLRDLKIYADYLSVEREKAELSRTFARTEKTFTMRGYVPAEDEALVREAVAAVTEAHVLQFFEPAEEDTPPTLTRNRGPVKAAEFVTNMYSVPDYREFDPNVFVFAFFMLFFGIIMADIGYGVLLFLGGLIVMKRRRANDGVRKLAAILMYGGIATAVMGALFGSCFGFSLYSCLPDPSSGSRTNVLTILLGCLALGLLQITVGYILSAVNSFRKGRIADALCDALTWVLFCLGLFFAVFNFITDYFGIPVSAGVHAFFGTMALPGVIMLGVGLAGAALTAGRKEKLLGKLTKGFGAVYGIINLLSDVLSYARLFGLMLSGMIIAQQFNGIGLDLIGAGSVGFVFGPVVILIGHAFNLAMGVLGAYIHDCRLQYIEFFSKFYTGEGTLFTPLGSNREYTYFVG